jgi:tetratricopeptide (TPR) repeat protein
MKPVLLVPVAALVASVCASASAAELGRPDLDSAEFALRFAASYGVLSAREPQISEIESAVLEKIAPMIEASPAQAEAALESLLEDGKPLSAAFNLVLGNLYYTSRSWSLAEGQYREAIRKFPDFQRAWSGLGTLHMVRDQYDEAAESLARSVELGANDAPTYGMLGYALLRTGSYEAAEVAYNLALLRDPRNVQWLEGKARILAEVGRHAETLAATDELLAVNPRHFDYWRLQANAHLALGHLRETVRSLEIARAFGRLDASALFLLGNLYLRQGLAERALDQFLAAIELDPRSRTQPTTLLRVVHSLAGQNQFELAGRLLDRLEPGSEGWSSGDRVLHALLQGRLALERGTIDEAVTAFEGALVLEPTHAEALYRLAVVHAEHDRPDKARYLLEKIRGDVNYEYGAQLYLARMLVNERRFSEAMPYLRNAYRLRPSAEIESLYTRVRVAAESG